MSDKAPVVDLWKVEVQPRPTKQVSPEVPTQARGKSGVVTVLVLVSPTGKVEKIGKVMGTEIFHEAVKEAVAQWEFSPAILGGQPVRVWIPLSFKISG